MSVSPKFRISQLNPCFSQALLIASPSLDVSYPISEPVHSSPYRFHEVVHQVDLVPTLSVLFDLGIPKYASFSLVRLLLSNHSDQYLCRNSMGRLMNSAISRLRPSGQFAHFLEDCLDLRSGTRSSRSRILSKRRADDRSTRSCRSQR